jgi:4-amino-4-deoxy-L-arabinose transferase-like glycosyltransferase
LGVFIACVATIDGYGLTWDEPFYIENAKSIEYWITHASSDTEFFTKDSIEKHWNRGRPIEGLTGNVHPPFFKLSAIFFRHTIGTTFFENVLYQYRVSTAFWAAILVVMLFLVIKRFCMSTAWALLGSLSFIASPRFFAHAHFFATDMLITSLSFSGLAVFMFASNPWLRIVLGGALFGAALATKFTGILAIAIVAPLIIISDDRNRFVREYFFMILVACVCFSIFNPPVLVNPYKEISFYFSSFFNREKLLPVTTAYFGKPYNFNLPFHHPWVLLGITLPLLMVPTALIGIISGISRFIISKDKFAYFLVAPFMLLMTVYMLPTTPKHDGIRLFSNAWPFIVLLSVYGCCWLQDQIKWKFNIGMTICIVSIIVSVADLRAYHPYELSYYNQFIGGTKGAQEKGFTVSYWYDAFNNDFFRQMAQIVGSEHASIYSWPNDEILLYNQDLGLYPLGLRSVSALERHEYILVLNRYIYPEALKYITGNQPLIELTTRDGAYIGGLYRNLAPP